MSGEGSRAAVDTVGSLLALIAYAIHDALRTLAFADKSVWGPSEFEQLRLLEETLDEAKRDFQVLPALINRRFYYENDRKGDSLDELREIHNHFEEHSQNFKDWVRTGGPIDPEWAVRTRWLRRELHRAQCRAVRRIHDDLETSSSRPRCLGALIVWRSQHRQQSRTSSPQAQHRSQSPQQRRPQRIQNGTTPIRRINPSPPTAQSSTPLSGEVAACNSTGVFQRLGSRNRDIAFVCDFCDGFIVWEDLRSMPSTRQCASTTTSSTGSTTDNSWAATGFAHPHKVTSSPDQDSAIELSERRDKPSLGTVPKPLRMRARPLDAEAETERKGEEKTIVFPPVAVANHLPPLPGEWQAPLLCPLCEEYYYEEQGDGDMDRLRYTQDEHGFEDVAALQAHLEWAHGSLIPGVAPEASTCVLM
ncbi:hypothetical protein GGR50DRAFT_637851 [Xylaria sp. CBS 124048]|nr:hypothetical protein GGR50DRAFT_637851 [Xylaria sp. CBS 124048]